MGSEAAVGVDVGKSLHHQHSSPLCPVPPGRRGPHRIHSFGQVPPSHDQSAAGEQVSSAVSTSD